MVRINRGFLRHFFPLALIMSAFALSLTTIAAASQDFTGQPDPAENQGEAPSTPQGPHLEELYGRLPLYFIENRGQIDKQVIFYAQGNSHATFFTRKGVVLSLNNTQNRSRPNGNNFLDLKKRFSLLTNKKRATHRLVQIEPLGMEKGVKIEALEPQEYRVNYLIGNDPKKWRTNIRTYQAVVYREVYKGIDLKFYDNSSQMEYDIVVKPGADPNQVKFKYAGIKSLEVTEDGDLAILLFEGGSLIQKKPMIYQEIAGHRVAREGKFSVQKKTAQFVCAFEVASYNPHYPLIIDPVLVYSTYLGGTDIDFAYGIAVDSTGNAYITGQTRSIDFPTKNPLMGHKQGGIFDAFITKINAAGNALIYSTYLGGKGDEQGRGIAVDAAGNAYVTGYTNSLNFPTENPIQPFYGGGTMDAFVTKLSPDGAALIYSTYLGGSSGENGSSITVDDSGSAYVTGPTDSINFPTKGAIFPSKKGSLDGFVAKINPEGTSLVYSTYLGGKRADYPESIAIDKANNAYVTGLTYSIDFPLKDPLFPALRGGTDVYHAFVTKINAAGNALIYSTYLGGGGIDAAFGIAVDATGNAYVTGYTHSLNFPTKNPLQPTKKGVSDAFVTKINPDGTALLYSTFLGGSGHESGDAISIDSAGNAYVLGTTDSVNFPTKNQLFNFSANQDGFLTKINSTGNELIFSTFIGGTDSDSPYSMALAKEGSIYLTGYTYSSDFPTNSPIYRKLRGSLDGFVAKIAPYNSMSSTFHLLLRKKK